MTLEEFLNRDNPLKDFSWFFITNFLINIGIPSSTIPLSDEGLFEYIKKQTEEDPGLYQKLDAHLQEFWRN